MVPAVPVLNSNDTQSGCMTQSLAQAGGKIPACDDIECASELTSRLDASGSAKLCITVPGQVGACDTKGCCVGDDAGVELLGVAVGVAVVGVAVGG